MYVKCLGVIEMICPKCNVSPVNATGVMCDSCMISGGGIYTLPTNTPPKMIEPVRQPTATDESKDAFDSFTKSFNNGLEIKVIINYTKNFSEIAIFKDGRLTDTKTYTDKTLFETTLKNAITAINKQEEELKRIEEEKKKYFQDIKSVVSTLGFEEVKQIDEDSKTVVNDLGFDQTSEKTPTRKKRST